jgi:hypothetical protein
VHFPTARAPGRDASAVCYFVAPVHGVEFRSAVLEPERSSEERILSRHTRKGTFDMMEKVVDHSKHGRLNSMARCIP